jgi:hypothetical protein
MTKNVFWFKARDENSILINYQICKKKQIDNILYDIGDPTDCLFWAVHVDGQHLLSVKV